MKKWFYIIPLLLMASCSDYVKVGGTFKHGNVPATNYNKTEDNVTNINPPVIEEITNPINISFWTFYVPFLVIVLYITYKTFKTDKINN
jgi:hypothetical protein